MGLKNRVNSYPEILKFLKEELEIFFEKTSKTQLEQGLIQLKDDLLEILDIFLSRYELSNKEIQLKKKESLMSLSLNLVEPAETFIDKCR